MKPLLLLSLCLGLAASRANADAADHRFDVVVYDSSPGGVAAAVNAAGEGMEVALFTDGAHIGGLPSGGLTNTDFKSFQSLGGTWYDFQDRVEAHYAEEYGPDSPQVADCRDGAWYEPKVARQVFTEMLQDAGVTLFINHRVVAAHTEVNEHDRRQLVEATFRDLTTGSNTDVAAKVFIDASYEGDLMALAGADYEIGDIQSYNFRVTMSSDPANQIPISSVKPPKYDDMDFTEVKDYLLANPDDRLTTHVTIRIAPNNKADFNTKANSAAVHFSIDGNGWTEGSPEYRQAMYDQATTTAQGLFYFLATDPSLDGYPIQNDINEWGYPADEYLDTGGWTPELYIREGRKMVGEYEMTSWDLDSPNNTVRSQAHRDAVAIGDYPSVAHREFSNLGISAADFLEPGAPVTGTWPDVESTGESSTRDAIDLSALLPATNLDSGRWRRPFEVPYGAIVPVSLDGLLVPVALSADDNLFNAIRMEPTWTALGQAAGLAGAQAIKGDLPLRDINVDYLRRKLHLLGAKTFYSSDVDRTSPYFQAVQYFGNLGFFHASELIATATNYPAPVSTNGSQWFGAVEYHDTILLQQPQDPGSLPTVTVETVSIFDENSVNSSTVTEVANGGNLTVQELKTAVETAAASGQGGVVDFENGFGDADVQKILVNYGAAKPLEITTSLLVDVESDPAESISGTHALDSGESAAKSGYRMDFKPPLETFGIVSVDDDGRNIGATIFLQDGTTIDFDSFAADGTDRLVAWSAGQDNPIVAFSFSASNHTRWDDLAFATTLEPVSDDGELHSGAVLTAEVEAFWRACYLAEFGEGSLDDFPLTADGEITRGEYLQALFRYTVPDTDMDHLPDQWESDRHGNIDAVNGLSDPDFDGDSELIEFATDGKLDQAFQRTAQLSRPYPMGDSHWIDLFYRQSTALAGLADLVVQASSTLTENSWTTVVPDGVSAVESVRDTNPDGDFSAVLYQIQMLTEGSPHFYRLKVQPNPY